MPNYSAWAIDGDCGDNASIDLMQIGGEAPSELLHCNIVGHDFNVQQGHAAALGLIEHQPHQRRAEAAATPVALDAESQFAPLGIMDIGKKFAGAANRSSAFASDDEPPVGHRGAGVQREQEIGNVAEETKPSILSFESQEMVGIKVAVFRPQAPSLPIASPCA